ncbi:hypothetical protein OVS_02740 [Mycoplasma ovis str. Michigan]|uniref:Uncharacterized protein n=2 Tax=Mycoplasma ovis TaxID=171632 RepID=A0ABM5P1I9_9MOLU|nr:hypothetical protein OVS_02740 [Mycoplasma ovis str. Michigan]
MMLPLKYFMPMIGIFFGGFTAANQWSAREGGSRTLDKSFVADSSTIRPITELPFPGYKGSGK